MTGIPSSNSPCLSVVIATKNRDDQLRAISLPSLAMQVDAPAFEVIVWDASDNDRSLLVAEEFAAAGLNLHYFKAPRLGLARQRNDALRQAKGEIVFFIDDDSEVSPDGLRVLAEMFAADRGLAGGCLPLEYNFPTGTLPAIMRVTGAGPLARIVRGYYMLFEPAKKASGYYPPLPPRQAGPPDYMFGCDMAFRREVFQTHLFEERLQRFSNYPLCDDLLFSRVLIQQGRKLRVASQGLVIHRPATGGRLNYGFSTGRVEGYNAGIVWLLAAWPWSRLSIFSFLWARTGVLLGALLACVRRPWELKRWGRVAGYLAGLWSFFWEEFVGFNRGKPHPAAPVAQKAGDA